MLTLKKNLGFYIPAAVFAIANCILLSIDIYWLAVLPGILFVVWMAFYQPKYAILFIAFFTPLSLKVDFEDYGVSINLPTEPVLMILMMLFYLGVLKGQNYDWKIFKQPLSILIIISMVWILVTALTSSMFIVSIKFFIARMWFVTIAYFISAHFFKSIQYIIAFISLFTFSLGGVVVYALVRHYNWSWVQELATYAPRPFFSDHGDYAAIVALFIPIILVFALKPKIFGFNRLIQTYFAGLALLFFAGVLFSYTRAAWLSLAVAFIFLIIFLLRIRFSRLIFFTTVTAVLIFAFQATLLDSLKKNKKVSTTDFASHVVSATNISTDASNTERINRWKSALRMFEERPVFGFGPGTYMFQYAPYQLSSEMTIISTNTGALGNAHSEYIGPLAESGVLGIITMLLVFGGALWKGMQIIYRAKDERVKFISIGITLGLITYFVHGFVNDYLERDKAAIPFWAFYAILTAMDFYYIKTNNRSQSTII